MNGLDKRLFEIVSNLKPGDRVADVGCDHGKVAVAAVKITENRVIATDISAPSLKKAVELADRSGVSDMIDFRVGDGVSVLKNGEADTLVVAGMGGIEIAGMIGTLEFKKYVLCPHSSEEELREKIISEKIVIQRDYPVFSKGKFYRVIVAGEGEKTENDYTEAELLFGKTDEGDREEYLSFEKQKIQSVEKVARGERKAQLQRELALLEELK